MADSIFSSSTLELKSSYFIEALDNIRAFVKEGWWMPLSLLCTRTKQAKSWARWMKAELVQYHSVHFHRIHTHSLGRNKVWEWSVQLGQVVAKEVGQCVPSLPIQLAYHQPNKVWTYSFVLCFVYFVLVSFYTLCFPFVLCFVSIFVLFSICALSLRVLLCLVVCALVVLQFGGFVLWWNGENGEKVWLVDD